MLTEQQIQEEIDFVTKIITHPAGYDLDLFGSLCIRPTDQGVWCVSWEQNYPENSLNDIYFCTIKHKCDDNIVYEIEKSFLTAKEAAEFFVRFRVKQEIGIDFEEVSFNQSKEHNE